MMVRPFARAPKADICQICELITAKRLLVARRTFPTLNAGNKRANVLRDGPARGTTRLFVTSRASPGVKRARDGGERATPPQELPELSKLVAAVDQIKSEFLSRNGIPSEEATMEALRAIEKRDFRLVLDAGSQPQIPGRDKQSRTMASDLLSLDTNGTRRPKRATSQGSPLQLQDVVDHISDAAYSIVSHPAVVITPRLLEEYVNIQARLGKPETLPQIFSLYASKPLPRERAGSVKFVPQRPNKIANAIDPNVAGAALDAAIEAKNLDAAVGIVENSYATKAFVRSKIVKRALVPLSILTATPVGAYVLASNLSLLQDSMDPSTATNIAFAGILAYVGFTATLGIVVITTANDQMKRVTWAPGTPLRQRWIREDERAALDKIACSFGFSEQTRYGEEEGVEFQALREYILRKGMVLDQIELMEGMG